jgi:hypothetical protein
MTRTQGPVLARTVNGLARVVNQRVVPPEQNDATSPWTGPGS